MWLEDVRFTQSCVNDSFSHEKRPIMELVDGLLSGAIDHRDVPLIRVAWHDGAFWSVDNRRTFVFKHCRLIRILAQVLLWEEQHEFEMKQKGGRRKHSFTNEGLQVGLVQRLPERPLPRSPISASTSSVGNYFDDDEQARHEELLDALERRRAREIAFEDQLASDVGSSSRIYEVRPERGGAWTPATVARAHRDGTFDMRVVGRTCVLPSMPASSIRPCGPEVVGQEDPEAGAPPPQDAGGASSADETFIMSRACHSGSADGWCARCNRIVGSNSRDLVAHDRSSHAPGDFRCVTCSQCFSSSVDLRRHSRSKQHQIHIIFMPRPDTGAEAKASPPPPGAQAPRASPDAKYPRCAEWEEQDEDAEADTFVVARGAPSRPRSEAEVQCTVCGSRMLPTLLREHERARHDPQAFKCASCKRNFSCSEDLRRHSRSTGHKIPITFQFRDERASEGTADGTTCSTTAAGTACSWTAEGTTCSADEYEIVNDEYEIAD